MKYHCCASWSFLHFLILSQCVFSMRDGFFHHLLKWLSFLWFPWASSCWKSTLCWLHFAYCPKKTIFVRYPITLLEGQSDSALQKGSQRTQFTFWTTQKVHPIQPSIPSIWKIRKVEVYTHWSLVQSGKPMIFIKIISLFIQLLSAVCHTEFYTIKWFFPGFGKLFI